MNHGTPSGSITRGRKPAPAVIKTKIELLPVEGPYDCTVCGACCVATPENPASDLYGQDNPFSQRCGALAGEIGKCVSCQIYAQRPSVCAMFEPGCDGCRKARARASRVALAEQVQPRPVLRIMPVERGA